MSMTNNITMTNFIIPVSPTIIAQTCNSVTLTKSNLDTVTYNIGTSMDNLGLYDYLEIDAQVDSGSICNNASFKIYENACKYGYSDKLSALSLPPVPKTVFRYRVYRNNQLVQYGIIDSGSLLEVYYSTISEIGDPFPQILSFTFSVTGSVYTITRDLTDVRTLDDLYIVEDIMIAGYRHFRYYFKNGTLQAVGKDNDVDITMINNVYIPLTDPNTPPEIVAESITTDVLIGSTIQTINIIPIVPDLDVRNVSAGGKVTSVYNVISSKDEHPGLDLFGSEHQIIKLINNNKVSTSNAIIIQPDNPIYNPISVSYVNNDKYGNTIHNNTRPVSSYPKSVILNFTGHIDININDPVSSETDKAYAIIVHWVGYQEIIQ